MSYVYKVIGQVLAQSFQKSTSPPPPTMTGEKYSLTDMSTPVFTDLSAH